MHPETDQCVQAQQCGATREASVLEQLESEASHLIARLAQIERAKVIVRGNPDIGEVLRLIRGY